jgi:hypothetical protein
MQGSRWASPMSPFAIFNFIWRQNTALGDFFGDNIFLVEVQIIYILYLSGQDTFFYKNLATEMFLLYRGKDK